MAAREGTVEETAAQPRARSVLQMLALAWIGLVVTLALVAPILPLDDPNELTGALNRVPGLRADQPLGTDHLGRDELARLVFGARMSLQIVTIAVMVGMFVGALIGMLAAYFAGAVDAVFDTIITALMAFPPLILLLALVTVLTPSATKLALVLAWLAVPVFARIARANTLRYKNREFVRAARGMGAGHARILFGEILPNVAPSLLSYALISASTVLVAEGSLSFLGLGVRPPQSSWGVMISAAQPKLQDFPHQVFVPAAAFVVTILSLNVIGDAAITRSSQRSA